MALQNVYLLVRVAWTLPPGNIQTTHDCCLLLYKKLVDVLCSHCRPPTEPRFVHTLSALATVLATCSFFGAASDRHTTGFVFPRHRVNLQQYVDNTNLRRVFCFLGRGLSRTLTHDTRRPGTKRHASVQPSIESYR